MKAIYINLDPYLQAVADWLNAGKPGTAPSFNPLPVAVTIPLGQDAVLLVQGNSDDGADTEISVDGQTVYMSNSAVTATDTYYGEFALSAFSGFTYWTRPVSGDTSITIYFKDSDETFVIPVTIPVLVRRETASGPVDLVDFTPPSAALTAAAINTALGGTGAVDGSPLKGVSLSNATGAPAPSAADIKSALVTAGPTALAGVGLGGTYLLRGGEGAYGTPTLVATDYSEGQYSLDGILAGGDEIQSPLGTGSASA